MARSGSRAAGIFVVFDLKMTSVIASVVLFEIGFGNARAAGQR